MIAGSSATIDFCTANDNAHPDSTTKSRLIGRRKPTELGGTFWQGDKSVTESSRENSDVQTHRMGTALRRHWLALAEANRPVQGSVARFQRCLAFSGDVFSADGMTDSPRHPIAAVFQTSEFSNIASMVSPGPKPRATTGPRRGSS